MLSVFGNQYIMKWHYVRCDINKKVVTKWILSPIVIKTAAIMGALIVILAQRRHILIDYVKGPCIKSFLMCSITTYVLMCVYGCMCVLFIQILSIESRESCHKNKYTSFLKITL